MPGRKYSAGSHYRYGFNGQEKSDELGEGFTTAEFWEYDSRIGRRWNVDPVLREYESPYTTFAGNPIFYNDPNGDDPDKPKENGTKEGERQQTSETTYASLHSGAKTTVQNWFWHAGGLGTGKYQKSADGKTQSEILTQSGWYSAEGYSELTKRVASDLAGFLGINVGALTIKNNWTAKQKEEVRNTSLGQFLQRGIADDGLSIITARARYIADHPIGSGRIDNSSFNVEDMIGAGILLKGLVRGLFKKSLSYLPKGGLSFSQYKDLRGGTSTLGFIETTNAAGQPVLQRVSVEFSHMFITQRTQKAMGLPNWLVNNRLNVWKLNTIQHSLIDPFRKQFLRAGLKNQIGFFGNMRYNWFSTFHK